MVSAAKQGGYPCSWGLASIPGAAVCEWRVHLWGVHLWGVHCRGGASRGTSTCRVKWRTRLL